MESKEISQLNNKYWLVKVNSTDTVFQVKSEIESHLFFGSIQDIEKINSSNTSGISTQQFKIEYADDYRENEKSASVGISPISTTNENFFIILNDFNNHKDSIISGNDCIITRIEGLNGKMLCVKVDGKVLNVGEAE